MRGVSRICPALIVPPRRERLKVGESTRARFSARGLILVEP